MVLGKILAEVYLKMHYFCHKAKNGPALGVLPSDLLDFSGWELHPSPYFRSLSMTRNYAKPLFRKILRNVARD